MIYANVIEFLSDLQMFDANFGLECAFKLAALAGNPQEQLRFIHVAAFSQFSGALSKLRNR